MVYSLNPVSYSAGDLSPAVPADWLTRHRDVHHAGYLRRVNALLDRYPQLHGRTVEDLLRKAQDIPEEIRDELLFEAPEDEVDALSVLVRSVMEQAATLSVPCSDDSTR